MSNQSKKMSFVESLTNIFIGYCVAVLSQLIIFPVFKIDISFNENLLIGLFFTVISLVRSYLLRRLFNTFTQ